MSTTGIELKTRRRALAEAVELVSSMRFAISLLTIIAIAAMIGTVMKQNEPMPNYVNQFGPFWFEVFDKLGLYAVYSAWWFLLILTFLITVDRAVHRRATRPKMIKDMRSWRENVREVSLRNFHHKAEWSAPLARAELARQTAARLADAGYTRQDRRKGTRHAGGGQARARPTSSATSSRTAPSSSSCSAACSIRTCRSASSSGSWARRRSPAAA